MAWKKPNTRFYKVNVSGVCEWGVDKASVGCVMRNDYGDYYRGFGGYFKCGNPEVAALWAIYYCLELAWGKGRKKLVLETDDATALQNVLTPDPNYKYGALVGAINQPVEDEWKNLQLGVVPPSVNGAATAMVDHCQYKELSLGELEDPPEPVKKVVDEEKV